MNATDAAHTVIETITQMAQEQRPLMLRVLPDGGESHFWKHYPKGDARDAKTRSRWYYHVHAPGSRDEGEHGHFHLFLHRTQLPMGLEPKVWPPQGEDCKAHVTHLVGLSIDTVGIPRAWFTVNRFVTNEFLFPADVMIEHLPDFNVDETKEDDLVNRFVTAMVALYREEIAELLRQRDARHVELVAKHGEKGYEKESGVEVLSQIPIDLDAKISSLDLE
ncbi:hypothetical protein [Altererythrobacter sp.]|uniref:DUF6969 family protein n=1 Tax=Altererythrobacter sp. TaxID=1872480 RepID=UPI001B16EED1|nr:hypothetical protein [Altererythrobacter sp.]MBO6608718.1 hypothetical protein [Altererythrobacter sp.]MBO6642973.1 hypothetical protein [Altererythrobacter sp.]MBO6709716.1 hypothetical protein [Altererythrobacter sp.]